MQFVATQILSASQKGFSGGDPGPQSIWSSVQTFFSGHVAWHSSVHLSTQVSLPETRLIFRRDMVKKRIEIRAFIFESAWRKSKIKKYTSQ